MSDLQPSPEERFYQNVIGLCELIYDIVCDVQVKGVPVVHPDIIQVAITLLQHMNYQTMIEAFISKSDETCIQPDGSRSFKDHCWVKIHSRDRDFFLNNTNVLFSQLPPDHVKLFGNMFKAEDENGNNVVPKEDEDEVWEFFHSLVKISIKYVHEQRDPIIIVDENGKHVKKYGNKKVFPNLELEKHAEMWNVYLPF